MQTALATSFQDYYSPHVFVSSFLQALMCISINVDVCHKYNNTGHIIWFYWKNCAQYYCMYCPCCYYTWNTNCFPMTERCLLSETMAVYQGNLCRVSTAILLNINLTLGNFQLFEIDVAWILYGPIARTTDTVTKAVCKPNRNSLILFFLITRMMGFLILTASEPDL